MLVNLDYVIGWTLSALLESALRRQLLFEGGACAGGSRRLSAGSALDPSSTTGKLPSFDQLD